jgi:FkbM family methyltransferase
VSLKVAVRNALSKNPATRNWFVGFAARFTVRLYSLQTYLSVDDLKAKWRAALWRQFAGMMQRASVEKVVFENGNATFYYKDGCTFQAAADTTSISSTQYSHGDYEPHETALMARVVSPGWIVVDAGANFGWHAVHLSKLVGPEGRVISFEPIPRTFKELKANAALNACDNLEARQEALGDTEGEITIYVPSIHLGAGAASQFLDAGEPVKAPILRLDDFLERRGIDHVDFIKADIEGGELNLLRGAEKLFSRCRPRVMIEIVDIHCKRFGFTTDQVIQFFASRGYRGSHIAANGELQPFDISQPPNGNFYFEP